MPLFKRAENYNTAELVKAAGIYPYFRKISTYEGSHVIVDGKKKLMLGSNNYLGLSQHPEVIKSAQDALVSYGSGGNGSRFLSGNLDLHDNMEASLARFLKKEACVIFSTGFLANLGAIATLSSRQTIIFSDRDNHASILEGCAASSARLIRYKHNDMQDLEGLLKKNQEAEEKLIVTDGVFSMTGVVVNLPRLTQLAKQYGARVYVDDAHALGVLGKTGAGSADHFGLQHEVDLIMGTFSKSLSSIGGFVAGPKNVINYIKHHARPVMFCAGIPAASIAAAHKCLEIIEREPERIQKLHANTARARDGLRTLGYSVIDGISAIVPVQFQGDMTFIFTFAKALFDEGLFSTPIIPPAVPQGSIIRTSYMASHTFAEIDQVLSVFEKIGQSFGIIPKKHKGVRVYSEALEQQSATV